MGKKRKERYRWVCTGCGHEIVCRPDGDDYEALTSASDRIIKLAEEHLKSCPSPSFEDVDGYYPADACCDPYTRPVVRRVRKIAFVRMGKNKTLHLDYGAEHTPCGMEVADQRAAEVSAADFYSGLLPKLRLCATCLAYQRPGIGEEMVVIERLFRGGAGRARS